MTKNLRREDGAILPRGNGKTTRLIRNIYNAIDDMLLYEGLKTDYKIYLVCSREEDYEHTVGRLFADYGLEPEKFDFLDYILLEPGSENVLSDELHNKPVYDIFFHDNVLSSSEFKVMIYRNE